jgi:hypothetical protein
MPRHTPAEIATAMKELEEQSDRGAAIVAASILENHLEVAIQHRLMEIPASIEGNLWGPRGHLSGFQAKIDLGLALGLLTKEGHRDLDIIRQVRNRFAHTPIALTFGDPKIKQLCSRLLLLGDKTLTLEQKLPRNRFMIAFLVGGSLLYFMRKISMRVTHVSAAHPNLGEAVIAAIYASSPEKS